MKLLELKIACNIYGCRECPYKENCDKVFKDFGKAPCYIDLGKDCSQDELDRKDW